MHIHYDCNVLWGTAPYQRCLNIWSNGRVDLDIGNHSNKTSTLDMHFMLTKTLRDVHALKALRTFDYSTSIPFSLEPKVSHSDAHGKTAPAGGVFGGTRRLP